MLSAFLDKLNRRATQLTECRDWAALAKAQTGKSAATQLREIRALRSSSGHCGVSDYYWYKLYDDSYMMGRGARDFLGWRLQQQFSLALNPRNAALPAWDKVVFSILASEASLPLAPIRACFHPARKTSGHLGIHLRTTNDVAAWLRDPSLYPMFGKPAYSQQGYGSLYMAGYDSASDSLCLLNGNSLAITDFLKRLTDAVDRRFHKPESGFVFQQAFRPAPEIAALTGWSAICGARVVCLNGPEGVRPIRAIWKIAVPPNHVDNFSLGKYGNLVADIDLASGQVHRAVNGFWPRTSLLQDYPTTGHALEGFQLPGWKSVLDACRCAGTVFPLLKIHHWDVAFTEEGPRILELNDIGATEFLQLHGHGLLTEETREFVKRFGDSCTHPWIKDL